MQALGRLILDPLIVVDPQGRLVEANRRAEALLGGGDPEHQPHPFVLDNPFWKLVEAASGSGDPVLGAVVLDHKQTGKTRLRVRVLAFRTADGSSRFAFQIMDTRDDQFAFLTRRVKELHTEIAQRQASEARLQEALSRNAILYRELQHRIKNHLHMVTALVTSARRDAPTDETRDFLKRMEAKLAVVAQAQRLMYVDAADRVPADELLEAVVEVVSELVPRDNIVETSAIAMAVDNDVAFPLSLIIHELLTNAVKYGMGRDGGKVRVSLAMEGTQATLEVRDWGPGFVESAQGLQSNRSSGLSLVRGLCRQIGGRIEIITERGTLVRVLFPVSGNSS